ncbi:acyl-CoA dehydrogenase family protein [Sphingosinicella microcystinivorans]|uniref:Acyl-CoA dehydrogenase n=1 Tax=Sphingosinicella microcystinivorans TaxID=335406 RepID=A0AAD1D8M6_SPHMI|nr:acyl-CoA dehydrogenase [Sphingosinicella microcystinivorans]RKS88092.1 acyl-CoA dehydrogenase [Sphingosinicella microcystinivorans]BBE35903.1 isovaleryl-CoA dehydrogenase [Sphingosinicella microcystinivorans]
MALVLTDEQAMIREAADGFFATEAPVSELRRLRDTQDATGFSADLWKKMAEMGFAGVLVPEVHGGSGLGLVAANLIQEAVGRNLSLSPFLSTAVLGATALAGANEDQQAALLPKLAAGDLLLALASDEASRHAPHLVRTRAEAAGNGFRITGTKSFVLDGHIADRLIVAARTSGEDGDRDGITLFLVDPKAAGVAVKRTTMVDSRNAADIRFDGVQVDGADVIGTVGEGATILDRVLDAGRTCLAAEMVGVSVQSFSMTVGYLKEREQFGRKIGSFQALQHRAAQLYCEIELAKSATLKAAQALDAGDKDAPLYASLAKAKAGAVARLATNEGVQMHGGIGMTDEYDIGFFMKRARAAEASFGDLSFHGDRLARMLGY